MAYIKERLKDEISVEHFYYLKRRIKNNLGTKLSYLRKDRTAFIAEIFFRRVSELEKLQKEQWRLFNDNTDNPYLQKDGLRELHQLTITLANMYDALPPNLLDCLSYMITMVRGDFQSSWKQIVVRSRHHHYHQNQDHF